MTVHYYGLAWEVHYSILSTYQRETPLSEEVPLRIKLDAVYIDFRNIPESDLLPILNDKAIEDISFLLIKELTRGLS